MLQGDSMGRRGGTKGDLRATGRGGGAGFDAHPLSPCRTHSTDRSPCASTQGTEGGGEQGRSEGGREEMGNGKGSTKRKHGEI